MGIGVSKFARIIVGVCYTCRFILVSRLFGFDDAAKILITAPKFVVIRILELAKANVGDNCDIETPIYFHNCKDLRNLTIGNNTHIGKDCFFDLRDSISIADNVVIAMQSTFITHIDLSKSELSQKYPQNSSAITIKSNVYIGAKALILMGVELGESSFIAGGSVVINSVPKFTLVAGVPAREIKKLHNI